jgi:aminotransferase
MKMGKFIAEKVNQIKPSGIRKYFDLLSGMEDSISLGVGEPDFSTPPHIREAAIQSLNRGETSYTSNSGMPVLRQELSRYLKDDCGVEYDTNSEMLITVGVSEALDLVMRAILNPGDEVISHDPCFVSYAAMVTMAGGKPVMVPTREENNFELEPADVEARITDKTKAILLGYPANPTGAVMPREKIAQIAEIAKRRGLLVISDEIYGKLVYGVEHTCVAALPGMKENTILLNGFSKYFAMTGWRVGYAAGPKEVIAAMTKIHQYGIMCVSSMSQVAAIEALKTGEKSGQEMLAEYDRRRKVIVKGFNDLGLSCFEPKGAFYAFPSVKSTGLSCEDFTEKLIMEEKVAVVPGTAFGEQGVGHVRCCYATSMENIEKALVRIARFVEKQKAIRVS